VGENVDVAKWGSLQHPRLHAIRAQPNQLQLHQPRTGVLIVMSFCFIFFFVVEEGVLLLKTFL
jgi:hypothetical protein